MRTFPGSRRYPRFNKENLRQALTEAGIEYFHFPELGGRRHPKPDSMNMAWRNETFRGYADYLETEEFRKGIDRLLAPALGVCRKKDFLCVNFVVLRVSVVKLLGKTITTKARRFHGAPQRAIFLTDS